MGRRLAACALAAYAAVAGPLHAQTAADAGAAALQQKYTALAGQLANNPYRRPLVVDSVEASNTVSGNAYAVLDSSFASVSSTFKSPQQWCEVLILHLNTKYCRAGVDGRANQITMFIGRKHAQELKDTVQLDFNFQASAASAGYLRTGLNSDKGPVGTSNYRISLQAIPVGEGKTFMHLQYSYDYGLASKIAMQGYLATLGSGKVGFTQGKSGYVGGVRGAVERNTMRYYLAIESYLSTMGRPAAQQPNARFEYWFDATEAYPEQLHEVDRGSYLQMKSEEHARQQKAP